MRGRSEWRGRCQRCKEHSNHLGMIDVPGVPGGRMKVCPDCYEKWREWKGLGPYARQ